MVYQASTDIRATPMALWTLLTDADQIPSWEPDIIRIDGQIAKGERLVVHTAFSDRAFPVTVTHFVPGSKMVWRGGMPLGLFVGVRTFSLEPLADGVTRFTTSERYSGPLLPLMRRSIPDLQPFFDRFAASLRQRAETQMA
ncbi:MAG: SRPBCC domain-containing protein [Bacteroidota bacterium]